MVKGDPGAESVFLWTRDRKGVNRRGAGPVDGKLLGRGSGEGFGGTDNEWLVLDSRGTVTGIPLRSKDALAADVLTMVTARLA